MARTILLPSIHVGLQTLRTNPTRTGLSVIGIVMGAASLAAVLSIGDGAERFVRQRIEREGLNAVSLQPRTSDVVDGLSIPRRDFPLFQIADWDDLAARLGVAGRVMLHTQGTGLLPSLTGAGPRAARVMAVVATEPGFMRLERGRWFTAAEMRQGGQVAIVSSRVTAAMGGDALGRTLRVQEVDRKVIGVLTPYPGERDMLVLVPFAEADIAMVPSPSARPRTLTVEAERVEDVAAVKMRIGEWARAHQAWHDGVTVGATGRQRLEEVNQGIRLFKLLMGAFTAISLFVGGIGIMNVLLSSVQERTREIGVRKASGARRRDIVAQFLSESVTIAAAGSLVGVIVGLLGAYLVTAFMRAQTQAQIYAGIGWSTVLVSAAAAATVGLVFGTYPALRAARLSPTEAMRYE